MSQSSTKWPPYALGPEAHIHALGVVAINYNTLEHALFVLLREYLGVYPSIHAYVFQSLNLHSTLTLFKMSVELHEKDDSLRERLVAFCPLFGTCFANRNLLMHANAREADATDELLALAKRSKNKPHIFNDMKLTLPELRHVADDMRALFLYTLTRYGPSSWSAAASIPTTRFRFPHCPIYLLRQLISRQDFNPLAEDKLAHFDHFGRYFDSRPVTLGLFI